ncbi:MAG: CRISPR-associated helicase Cas3' [Gracilibacteraceae bacterium]|jgi:CRISPR-associated endonuclease/helicase Cas3|nr:CRISPR-associated helicase Cas3' [Gracilibacteraceae bacterium]
MGHSDAFDLSRLFAKKDNEGNETRTLPEHLSDTATAAGQLYDKWLSDSLKRHFDKSVFVFCAALHDLGKATNHFQNGNVGHAKEGQIIFEYLAAKQNVDVKTISSVLGAHHGEPASKALHEPNAVVIIECKDTKQHYTPFDNLSEWVSCWEQLLKKALKRAGVTDLSALPKLSQAQQFVLTGAVIMADWLASGGTSVDKLGEKWVAAGSDDIYRERFEIFDNKKTPDSKTPNNLQDAVERLSRRIGKPGIMIIESETASGKTVAALAAAEIFAQKFGLGGVYFALPTQATSDGQFKSFTKWVKKAGGAEDNIDLHIQLLHGKAFLNKEFEEMPGNWFSQRRKRKILDNFGVGTIDQLLLAGLKQKHVMLRHLGLANKVIIIDECHAYDAYMNVYLKRVLEWLSAYNVPVIILSATLPVSTRNEMLNAYLGKDTATDDGYDYPRITYSVGAEVKYECIPQQGDQKRIAFEFVADVSEELSKRIVDRRGVIGIIVNTVKRSQDLYKALAEQYGAENVRLLHSRFIATDRAEKRDELENTIGPEDPEVKRPDFRIIIGTQVLEQSLDIDFDLLITELAPVDLLLQRIGRLHRHKRDGRPKSLQKPLCLILSADKNSHKIYGDYLLMRTEARIKQLQGIVTIPKDVAGLVNDVYSDKELSIADQELYESAVEKHKDECDRKVDKAEHFLLKTPELNDPELEPETILGMLDMGVQTGNENAKRDENVGLAMVRDTDPSIEVIVVEHDNNLDRNARPGDDSAKELAKHTIRLPRSLCGALVVEKTIKELENLAIQELNEWSQSPILKDELFILLDEYGETTICGRKLRYNREYGLEDLGVEERV